MDKKKTEQKHFFNIWYQDKSVKAYRVQAELCSFSMPSQKVLDEFPRQSTVYLN